SVIAIVDSPEAHLGAGGWCRRPRLKGRPAEFAGCMVNERLRSFGRTPPFPPTTAQIDDFYGGCALYVLMIRKYPIWVGPPAGPAPLLFGCVRRSRGADAGFDVRAGVSAPHEVLHR